MRLCIVSPFQEGGGAEYQIQLLIDALLRQHRIQIFHLVHHVSSIARPDGYRIVPIGKATRTPLLGYVMDFVPLYRALCQIQPQVIYQRVGCGYTGVCALYARRRRARLIWHVSHDTDVMPRSLDTGRNLLRRRLEKWSIELGIHWADRIVVQTQHQRDLLSRHYGRQDAEVIANFHADAQEQLTKTMAPTVVWIANLKPWKRPEVFVRLASRVGERTGAQFIMMGEAPSGPKHSPWLESLQRSIATTPALRFLGRQTQEQVNELLARAWVLVNTSLHEGFPNIFIQAWLRDTVVVSLDVDPDHILERESIGMHAGSEERLAESVHRLLTDHSLRASYAKHARDYARATHSLNNANRLIQLIENCAGADSSVAGALSC